MNKQIKYSEGTDGILFLTQYVLGTQLTTWMPASWFADGNVLKIMITS